MTPFCLILLLTLYLQTSSSAPTSMKMALVYLSKYGYLEPNNMNMDSSNKKLVKTGIKEFQSFVGLSATGHLNRATIKMMSMPRCGVKDITGLIKKRFDKFSTGGGRWKMMLLTYTITQYPSTMKKNDVDVTIKKAFNYWSEHTNIMFKTATSNVDIELKFAKGTHGDDTPFTGPGGVLAHAFFPALGGDVHFDDYETWTINSFSGTNLLQTAVHEIGHSLGLPHSEDIDAVMGPLSMNFNRNFMLHHDDITAIQNLYGKKKKFIPEPNLPIDPTEDEWNNYWNVFSI